MPRAAAPSRLLALFVALCWPLRMSGCSEEPSGKTPPGAGTPPSDVLPATETLEPVLDPHESPDQLGGFPRATWRLTGVAPHTMVLSAAQILIAYAGAAAADDSSLFVVRRATRSFEEARALTISLLRALSAEPRRFDELAKEHSDDSTTSAFGGRLGAFRGDQVPDYVLDALDVLPPGAISQQAVLTPHGFHILRLDPAPPRVELAARRIVIAHAGAREQYDPTAPSSRSMEEARVLAERLAGEARTSPERFSQLVAAHSDASDRSRGGDMGVSDLFAARPFPLRYLLLANTDESGVVGPVQTSLGFEIMQRTSARPRSRFTVSPILIAHGSDSPLVCARARRSPAEAKQAAEKLARQLRASPTTFDEQRTRLCDLCSCDGGSWGEGSGDPVVEHALRGAGPGQIRGPIATPLGQIVVRRELDAPVAPEIETVHLGLPRFRMTSFTDYVRLLEGPVLAGLVPTVEERVYKLVQLTPSERTHAHRAFEALRARFEGLRNPDDADAKLGYVDEWRRSLVSTLDARKASAIERAIDDWYERTTRR